MKSVFKSLRRSIADWEIGRTASRLTIANIEGASATPAPLARRLASRDGGEFSLRVASAAGAEGIVAKIPDRTSRYQIVALSFTPTAAGDQSGELTLIPATGAYRATTIGYHAVVAAAEVVKSEPEAEESQP